MQRAMCRIQLKDRKSCELEADIDLKEALGELAMANGVHWHRHVLNKEDGHVLSRMLQFKVEGQKRERRSEKGMGEASERRMHKCWVEEGKCTLLSEAMSWH